MCTFGIVAVHWEFQWAKGNSGKVGTRIGSKKFQQVEWFKRELKGFGKENTIG